MNLTPGITHDADWMARQAEQHGMFNGRTMTELLATQAGQAYLKRLLDAHSPGGLEKQNQYNDEPAAKPTSTTAIAKPTTVAAPSPAAYPSPTGAALGQLAARPGLPKFPTGRAAPARAKLEPIVAGNRERAFALADRIRGKGKLRADITAASRAQGYPKDPAAAPASTVGLLGRIYPHQLPPVQLLNEPTGTAGYLRPTGQIKVTDPLPGPGTGVPDPEIYAADALKQQQLHDALMPNRLGIIRHETEHGLQDSPDPRPPFSAAWSPEAQHKAMLGALGGRRNPKTRHGASR